MEPKPGIEALYKLADLGYRFNVEGVTIKARYAGPGEPDPAQVRPLLAQVGANKEEVLAYLKSPETSPDSRSLEHLPSEDKYPLQKICHCGFPAWGVGEHGQARCWPPIDGKDPGEMWQAGVELATWIKVGIQDHRTVIWGEKSLGEI